MLIFADGFIQMLMFHNFAIAANSRFEQFREPYWSYCLPSEKTMIGAFAENKEMKQKNELVPPDANISFEFFFPPCNFPPSHRILSSPLSTIRLGQRPENCLITTRRSSGTLWVPHVPFLRGHWAKITLSQGQSSLVILPISVCNGPKSSTRKGFLFSHTSRSYLPPASHTFLPRLNTKKKFYFVHSTKAQEIYPVENGHM